MNGDETGIDCGGAACAACPTVLIVAGGELGVFTAAWQGSGDWSTASLAEGTPGLPAVTLTAERLGVAMWQSTSGEALRAARWSSGVWSEVQDLSPGLTTHRAPALGSFGGLIHVLFQHQDLTLAHATLDSTWSPLIESVGEAKGPLPPQLAVDALGVTAALIDDSEGDRVVAIDRTASGWQSPVLVSPSTSIYLIQPSIVALSSGPERLAVWVRDDGQVMWSSRSAGAWSAEQPVPGASTYERVSLAALDGARACAAFRGAASQLRVSCFDDGVWQSASDIGKLTSTAPPALAAGVGGAELELSYLDNGFVRHARRVSGAWKPPTTVGFGNVIRLSIASLP